jgi:hypothetical protein
MERCELCAEWISRFRDDDDDDDMRMGMEESCRMSFDYESFWISTWRHAEERANKMLTGINLKMITSDKRPRTTATLIRIFYCCLFVLRSRDIMTLIISAKPFGRFIDKKFSHIPIRPSQ